MAGHEINRHRPLGPDELPARYRRAKHAEWPEERLVDSEEADVDEYHEAWDYEEWDSELQRFDFLWPEIEERIASAEPFNPVVPPRVDETDEGSPNDAESPVSEGLEERLAAHCVGLPELHLDELLGDSECEADIRWLARVAREHLAGSIEALVPLVLMRPFWIRAPRHCPPLSGGSSAVITALVEHLFLRYDVPRFLLGAWTMPAHCIDSRWLAWTVVLGQGGSLRRLHAIMRASARRSGWGPIAKKLPGRLFEVPPHMSPAEGVMYAEVLRLGGSPLEYALLHEDLSYRIDPTACDQHDDELRFWEQTVGWLARHRGEFDDYVATLILSWARHRHTERQREPFSWSGRTAASCEREARDYVYENRRFSRRHLRWDARGWSWEARIGDREWSLRELTTSAALREESKAMSHCVGMYDLVCHRGHSSIFSLRCDGRRSLTIEVRPGTRRIVQARGSCNRAATELERTVLARWVAEVLRPKPEESSDSRAG